MYGSAGMDKQSQQTPEEEEDDDDAQFKYNRYKNQHSAFYESLKLNVRSESFENLNGALSEIDTRESIESVSKLASSPVKGETEKMKKLIA